MQGFYYVKTITIWIQTKLLLACTLKVAVTLSKDSPDMTGHLICSPDL